MPSFCSSILPRPSGNYFINGSLVTDFVHELCSCLGIFSKLRVIMEKKKFIHTHTNENFFGTTFKFSHSGKDSFCLKTLKRLFVVQVEALPSI